MFRERHNNRAYYDLVKRSLGLLVCALVFIIFFYDVLEKFELTTFDYRMKLRKKRYANNQVVMVDMDENSIKQIGRWPWPREWHATLISALSYFGAEALVFDVIFSEPSNEFSDTALEEAMKKFGNVYIPYALELKGYNKTKQGWEVGEIIFPLERFSQWSKGQGHITIIPDSDGTIRRIPLVVGYEDNIYPQLGLKVACDTKGKDPAEYRIVNTPFSRYIKIGRDKPIYILVDKKNQMLINWVAKWGEDFKHYSYVDVITSYQNIRTGKKPALDLAEFKDKICLIGLTALGLYDIKPIPLQPAYPGVGAKANIISSILNEDFIKKAPRWLDGLIIFILGLLLSIKMSKAKPMRGAFIALTIAFAYLLISFLALEITKIWIGLIYPLATIILTYLVVTFYNQIVISIERAKLYTLATKDGLTGLFVIRHFNLLLEAEIDRVKPRGGKLSILMSDIDHFKKINDTYGHQVGDVILKETANIVKSCCRQLDMPSRYGGEEFIIMLPDSDIDNAAVVGERIRKKVAAHIFRIGNNSYQATISLGAAMFKNEDTRDTLIKKADAALYKAKEAGRNKVCLSEE